MPRRFHLIFSLHSIDSRYLYVLRRKDQRTVAALVAIGLSCLAAAWLLRGGLTNKLVDVDRAVAQPTAFTVDVNKAGWAELSQLPEIGETLAQRIIEQREKQGRFRSHDDLDRVSGIGPKTLAKMKPYLRPIPPAGEPVGQIE